MNVVDSCGWLEVFSEGENAHRFLPVLRQSESIIVPAIVLYEVSKRARVLHGKTFGEAIAALLSDRIVVEITRPIVAAAEEVSVEHKLSTADSLIYATAREYDAVLWTQDKHFEGLPHVKYVEKRA